jgi:hypothetical protein
MKGLMGKGLRVKLTLYLSCAAMGKNGVVIKQR